MDFLKLYFVDKPSIRRNMVPVASGKGLDYTDQRQWPKGLYDLFSKGIFTRKNERLFAHII